MFLNFEIENFGIILWEKLNKILKVLIISKKVLLFRRFKKYSNYPAKILILVFLIYYLKLQKFKVFLIFEFRRI